MGVFIISHPVYTHLGGPVRKPSTTSWGSAGDCRAQIWGLPWLQGGVFPASVSQWRQGGLPHPRPASDCSPRPPLLAEVRFPGPRPNCKGLPTHLLPSLPLQGRNVVGDWFPQRLLCPVHGVPATTMGAGLGEPCSPPAPGFYSWSPAGMRGVPGDAGVTARLWEPGVDRQGCSLSGLT